MVVNPYESPKTEASRANRTTRKPRRRFTILFWIGLANLFCWHIGVAFDSIRGLDSVGAFICISTIFIANLLVPISILWSYSIWLNSGRKEWDFYGPAIAMISVVLILFEVQMNMRY